MRITVVGAGALGGLIGALLHRAGEEVSFVARGETLRRLRERGIEVRSPLGDGLTGPLTAADEPSSLGESDVVLVAVKAFQVEALAHSLRPLVGPRTVVIPSQNGVRASEQLAAALGSGVVVGVWHVLARLSGPASVVHEGPPPQVALGERNGGGDRLAPVVELLARAGIRASIEHDISALQWEKLLFVEAFGAVGAAARSSVEVIRSVPETRKLLQGAMEEVASLAAARGAPVREGAVQRSLGRLDRLPPGSTASLHRDLVEARRSELEEQTGVIVALARQSGVPVPIHEMLWALLLPQEQQARLRQA